MGEAWLLSNAKRRFDLLASAGLLLLLSPLMVALAIAIALSSPGNPVFAQRRRGLHQAPFWLLKWRTMALDAEQRYAGLKAEAALDGPVFKLAADPRVTRIGRWLRRSSLDELPQLLCVLLGSMSLVGPRPLPLDQYDPADPRFARRCDAPPGITGLWQVLGRAMHVRYDLWLAEDCRYVDHATAALDAAILARTASAVTRGDGAC